MKIYNLIEEHFVLNIFMQSDFITCNQPSRNEKKKMFKRLKMFKPHRFL